MDAAALLFNISSKTGFEKDFTTYAHLTFFSPEKTHSGLESVLFTSRCFLLVAGGGTLKPWSRDSDSGGAHEVSRTRIIGVNLGTMEAKMFVRPLRETGGHGRPIEAGT